MAEARRHMNLNPREIERRRRALRLRIAARLREIRQARELSQYDLARSIGVSTSAISRLEAGRAELPLSQAVLIMERLQIWTVDLIVETKTPPRRDRFKHDDELVNFYGELDE